MQVPTKHRRAFSTETRAKYLSTEDLTNMMEPFIDFTRLAHLVDAGRQRCIVSETSGDLERGASPGPGGGQQRGSDGGGADTCAKSAADTQPDI